MSKSEPVKNSWNCNYFRWRHKETIFIVPFNKVASLTLEDLGEGQTIIHLAGVGVNSFSGNKFQVQAYVEWCSNQRGEI